MRFLASIPLLFLAGCAHTPTAKVTDEALREAKIDPATAATVSGRIRFTGPAPRPQQLDLSANPTCERQHLRAVYSEAVVVNKNGTLRNVLVWVKGGLPANHWTAPAQPIALNQEGCIYQPHGLALMTGQTLEVSNSDPLNHNVHAEAAINTGFNVAQPPRAEKLYRVFDRQEVMIPITCGVHPWMRANVSVVSHPFFALTQDDGSFSIAGLPPGTYTLAAIHETLGRQELSVTVLPREKKAVDFTYTAGSR